jgi:hypothetical protein
MMWWIVYLVVGIPVSAWLAARLLKRRELPRYRLDDLRNHRISVDMDELQARMAQDRRVPALCCKAERGGTEVFDGETYYVATPCWWPFCDC